MINHILFDLDCTLYSVRYGLEENVSRLIKEFVSSWLKLPVEESELLRREALKRYGTTMEWLVSEKGFTAIAEYQAFIHPADEADSLPPDPALRSFLESLPYPCSILTNSPGFHAHRIIKKLGLEGIFRRVFAIEDNNFKGKPHESAFRRALDALGMKPEEVLFIDDTVRYVEGFLAMGGRGILFDELDACADYPHARVKDIKEIVRFLDQRLPGA